MNVAVRNAVNMAEYTVTPLGADQGSGWSFALTPLPEANMVRKTWYLRSSDRNSYDGWLRVLLAAASPSGGDGRHT